MSAASVEPIGELSGCRSVHREYEEVAYGGRSATAADVSASPVQTDAIQFSPLAHLVSTLERLRESDPAKYSQVTRQIASNLQSAAEIACSQGNAVASEQLAQLVIDFSTASTSGQFECLLDDFSLAVGGAVHGIPGSSAGRCGTDKKLLTLIETDTSHSAQKAALNDAAILMESVSADVVSG